MKKIFCFFVMFLISNAANAEQWEYVSFTELTEFVGKRTEYNLFYPDGKRDIWEKGKAIFPPPSFKDFTTDRIDKSHSALINAMLKKDFSQQINVVNALGQCGFEMSGCNVMESNGVLVRNFWFKRKL